MAVLSKYRVIIAISVFALISVTSVHIGYAEESQEDIWNDRSPRQSRPPELTAEQMKSFVDGLAKEDKALVDKLNKLREDNPEKFREEVRSLMRQKAGGGPRGPRGPQGSEGKGPAGAGQGGQRRGGWNHERMKAELDKYIKWLEENYPDEAKKLAVALKEGEKTENYENYYRRFWSSRRSKYGQIMDMEKRNPELAEVMKEDMSLQQSRDELVKKIRGAKGKQLAKIKGELKKIVERRFDLIVIKKRLRYEELKKRIEQLQKEVAEQEAELGELKKQKATQTEERLKELIGTEEKINWK